MKSYEQRCSLALALDRIGDRWTLLVVRELLLGPARYSDLRQALPGVATNLLAQRLRELEAASIVRRRTLPPPAASVVYELTELGRGLEEAVLSLARWGGRFLGETEPEWTFRPQWLVLALRAMVRPGAAAALERPVTLDLVVDGAAVRVRAAGGEVTTTLDGDEGDPADARLEVGREAVFAFASGTVSLDQALDLALAGGLARLEGDRAAAEAVLGLFEVGVRD